MGTHVLVVANVSCSPEGSEEFGQILRELAAACREEPGCLSYEVFRSTERPGRFVSIEMYADAEAFAAHRGSVHFREIGMARLMPLVTERDVRMYDQPREIPPAKS